MGVTGRVCLDRGCVILSGDLCLFMPILGDLGVTPRDSLGTRDVTSHSLLIPWNSEIRRHWRECQCEIREAATNPPRIGDVQRALALSHHPYV